LRAGWEKKTLGEVCSLIKRGVAPKYLDAGGVAVLNQKCVRDHEVSFELGRRHDGQAKKVDPERYIRVGDVLVNSTGTGTLGRVAQVRSEPAEPTTVDTHVTIVRPNLDRFYPDFFGYMLIQIEDEIARSGEGASGQTELARTTLQNKFTVLFPTSLAEQQRIVGILDEAFAGLASATANAEKNLRNARELFESFRDSVFGDKGGDWTECSLGELVEIKHGFAFQSEYFASEGDYVLLTPGNFFEEGGYRDRGDKQKYYVGEIPDGFILKKGDFLIAMTEQAAGLLGSSVIVPEDNKFIHNQRLGLVQLKEDTQWSNEFFFHAFNTRRFRQEAHDSASGVKVRHTSPTKLGEIAVCFPRARAEQDKVARRLDDLLEETEHVSEKYELKLSQISELRQAILQKAFSGALTSPPPQAIKEAAE
jgi:type I restriction enzyme S subunit